MSHSQAVERVGVYGDQSAGKLTDYDRLIQEHGFQAVSVAADWPDAHRVNCYVVAVFVEWLRTDGESREDATSRAEVVRYLGRVDPAAARRARQRYACFDQDGEDEQAYGIAAGYGVSESCENFSAEQNARQNGKECCWSLFRGRSSTWNLRDSDLAETLQALAAWPERRSGLSRITVWEHNSHIGDARATQIGLPGSWGALFYKAGTAEFLLDFRGDPELTAGLAGERLERDIGVIYRPQSERISHYFEAEITRQFDAVIHIDRTRAVEPLDALAALSETTVPDPFPSGV